MAQSLVIEEESGTSRGWLHPHNGYYAGDFSASHAIVSECGAMGQRHLHAVVDTRDGTMTTSAVTASGREAA